MKQLAPVMSVTDMGDCADAFVMLAKNGPIIFHFFNFVLASDVS